MEIPRKLKEVTAGTWDRGKIRHNHGKHTGENRSLDAHAQFDQQECSAQPDQPFQHEIDRERTESVNSLNVSAAYSERNIERRSQREKRYQNRIGQIQIFSQAGAQTETTARPIAIPAIHERWCRLAKTANRDIRARALGHIFRAHDLKRQSDARHQHQNRVDRGGVCKPGGSEEPGRDHVVNEIGNSNKPRPGQQREAAAKKL